VQNRPKWRDQEAGGRNVVYFWQSLRTLDEVEKESYLDDTNLKRRHRRREFSSR